MLLLVTNRIPGSGSVTTGYGSEFPDSELIFTDRNFRIRIRYYLLRIGIPGFGTVTTYYGSEFPDLDPLQLVTDRNSRIRNRYYLLGSEFPDLDPLLPVLVTDRNSRIRISFYLLRITDAYRILSLSELLCESSPF